MSIQSEITRITNKRDASFTAVANKGVTVPSDSTIDDLPDLISQIQSGGNDIVLTGEINQSGGKTLYINGSAAESFSVDSAGGTIDSISGNVLMDLSDDTVKANTIKSGFTAHNSMGQTIIGTLNVSEPVLGTKTITTNGTYSASSDELDGYSSVTVQVPTEGGSTPVLQSKTATPSESVQTVTPDTGYDGLSSVEVGAISSTYVGTGVARKSSFDLTASGATVSVPAGYYAEAGSKSITSGSASTPATSITANPSITVSNAGLITASTSASQSVTPSISAGYVSSGTAGTVSVSGSSTEQLSTQAAATVTPTTSSQTIGGAGKYMTGAITVNPIPSNYIITTDANATTGDILSGKTAYVNGSKLTGTMFNNGAIDFDLSMSAPVVGENSLLYVGTIPGGYHNGSGSVWAEIDMQETITPTTGTQVISHSSSSIGIAGVTINPIPSNYITTSDATASASDILSGETAYVNGSKLTGTLVIQHYYTGTTDPSVSVGSDGDIYLKTGA